MLNKHGILVTDNFRRALNCQISYLATVIIWGRGAIAYGFTFSQVFFWVFWVFFSFSATTLCFSFWHMSSLSSSWVISTTIFSSSFIKSKLSAFCYSVIGKVLWGGGDLALAMNSDRFMQPAVERALEKKRNIVKMSFIVVTIFAICWIPYHVYFILVYFIPGKKWNSFHIIKFIEWSSNMLE